MIAAGVDICTRVRTALLSLGQRVAPKVAGKSDLLEIATLVNLAAREVLSELADHDVFNDAVLG